ncbi:TPA: hypothetical protein ACNICG_002793 [Acinetobacter baumannii]
MNNFLICVEADTLLQVQGTANLQINAQRQRNLYPISSTYQYVPETKKHVITVLFDTKH